MVRGAAIAPLFLREKHRTGVGLETGLPEDPG